MRKIPVKNYIILGIVIVVTMLILYYFYMWVDVYKESKISIPIMDKYMSVINYNELGDYVIENPNTIVYVSVLENANIREFEKKLKNKYKGRKIDADLLYMDVTDDIKNKDIRSEMDDLYTLNNLSIADVPCILVFNGSELASIYSVSDNDYDVDKFVAYVNSIGLESE